MAEQQHFKDPLVVVSAPLENIEEFFLKSHRKGEETPELEMNVRALGLFAGVLEQRKGGGLDGMWPSYDDENKPSNEENWITPEHPDAVRAWYRPETEMDMAFYLGKSSAGGFVRAEVLHGNGSLFVRGKVEIPGEEEFAASLDEVGGAEFPLEGMSTEGIQGFSFRRADRNDPDSPYISSAINLGRIIEPAPASS